MCSGDVHTSSIGVKRAEMAVISKFETHEVHKLTRRSPWTSTTPVVAPAAQQAYTLAWPSFQFRVRITPEALSSICFLSSLKLPTIRKSKRDSRFTSLRESGEMSRGVSGTEICANRDAKMF